MIVMRFQAKSAIKQHHPSNLKENLKSTDQ